jgi:hypothetical protein
MSKKATKDYQSFLSGLLWLLPSLNPRQILFVLQRLLWFSALVAGHHY